MEGKRTNIGGGSKTGAPGEARTAWRISVGPHQYGGFGDREEADLEASRWRELGAARVEVYEVRFNPDERVVGVARCERCQERMARLDRRVVSSSASVVCGPCSVDMFGHWDEEPTTVQAWRVGTDYVDEECKDQVPKRSTKP
jgi:hypothetical protein